MAAFDFHMFEFRIAFLFNLWVVNYKKEDLTMEIIGAVRKLKIIGRGLLSIIVVCLIACSDESSIQRTPASAPITEVPTPNPEANVPPGNVPSENENPPDDDSPSNVPPQVTSSDYYDRPFDYPNIATLPLQYLPTINGKRLGVRVTLPANEDGEPLPGPFPVILVQTGYNMYSMSLITFNGGGALIGTRDPYIVRHGYALAVVDVYGTGVSEGGWSMFGEEEQAGYRDTVDWVLQQPWSNGNLGVAGYSYLAISALFTAAQKPDQIKAVFAASPIGDAQRGTVGIGGTLNAVFMSYWIKFTQQLSITNGAARMQNPALAGLIESATQEHIDQIDNFYLPLIEGALNGEPEFTYNSHFWHVRSPLAQAGNIRAPTIITGALQDIFQRDAPLWYEQLKKNTKAHLVIYDGDHIRNFIQQIPGGDEVDPMLPLMLRWFDQYLKGLDTNASDMPAVTQFVKNYKKGLWKGFVPASDWPHPDIVPERWYLHGNRVASRNAPESDESSNTIEVAEQADVTFAKADDGRALNFDVAVNDGTRCSVSYRQWTLGIAGVTTTDGISPRADCYFDNTALEANALNFESAPMNADYYINGPIQADIWLETTGENAVLSVWLDEISPDGISMPISNGLLLASARRVDESRSRFIGGEMMQPYHYLTQEQELPVVPNEIFKMQVEIFPTSYIVRRGNRLRISIASSNQAQGILNYSRQAEVAGSTVTIHNSADYHSSVVLPVVPMSVLQ